MPKSRSGNGYEVRCDNCGEYLGSLPSSHGDFATPTRGGIAYRGGIIGTIKYFCNNNCKQQWKDNR